MESHSRKFYSTEEVLKFFTLDSQSDDDAIQSCNNLSSDDSDRNNESTKGGLYLGISDTGREKLSNEGRETEEEQHSTDEQAQEMDEDKQEMEQGIHDIYM